MQYLFFAKKLLPLHRRIFKITNYEFKYLRA